VLYRWHPWYGQTVKVVRTVEKRTGFVVRVSAERDGRIQQIELPRWMTDSVLCASMTLAERPVVSIDALQSVRELLEIVGSRAMVEVQHLTERPRGDADGKKAPSRAYAARPVSSSIDVTPLAGPATGGEAEGAPTGRPANEAASEERPGAVEQEERGR
jgi:hypothetical protein